MVKPEKKDKVKVTALPAFKGRRFVTLQGLNSKKDFRILKAGGAVEIDKKHFDPTLYREVKNGDK